MPLPLDVDTTRLLANILDALTADYHRRGGYLSGDHVLRAVEKRGLAPEHDAIVRRELQNRGIEIDDPDTFLDFSEVASADRSADDLIRRYLAEIGSISLLRPDEEVSLGRRVRAGLQAAARLEAGAYDAATSQELRKRASEGRQAAHGMLAANLRLVVSVAKHYAQRTNLDLLDLVQEGTLGLMKAVDKYDHTLGFKFSTYATWWIKQAITRAIADTGRLIRLPVHASEALARIFRAQRALTREYAGREPSVVEIAEQVGMRPEKVRFLLDISREPVSLDTPVADERETLFTFVRASTVPTPEQSYVVSEREGVVRAAIGTLKPKEAKVLERRFGLGGKAPQTLERVGRSMGLTRERIRQIEKKALQKLARGERRTALGPLWSVAMEPKTDGERPVGPKSNNRDRKLDQKGSERESADFANKRRSRKKICDMA